MADAACEKCGKSLRETADASVVVGICTRCLLLRNDALEQLHRAVRGTRLTKLPTEVETALDNLKEL